MIVPIFFRKYVAVLDNVLFQIESHHPYFICPHFMEKIIHGKRQVRFTTPKIKNCDLPILWKSWQNIIDKLQVTVDLPKLVKPGMNNLAILCHHAQIL